MLKTYSFCKGQNSQKPIRFIKVFKIPPVYAYKKPGATPSPKFEPGYLFVYFLKLFIIFIVFYIHIIHAYIYTYVHTYIHTYMHACMHKYIHTYIHPYIHACMHAYIYLYMHVHLHGMFFGKRFASWVLGYTYYIYTLFSLL